MLRASLIARRILEKAADWFMDVPERVAVDTMRLLARPAGDDPSLEIGESGVAGLAGLLTAATDAAARGDLLSKRTPPVLVIGTEGATDPELYRRRVARDRLADG